MRAYNSWLAEEYCATDPQRLIGVGILPLGCQLNDVIDELEFCSKAGLKTVLLQGFPSGSAYPSEADDRFWARTLELNMPVSVHVDLDRSGERKGPLLKYPKESEEIMKKLTHDLVDQVGRFGPQRGNGSIPAVQWVLSGVFDRFPTLRVFFAENQIGWIPFFLQGADVRYDRHYRWAERLLGFKPLKRPPSEYIREYCYWGFQFDRVASPRDKINVNRLKWGSDFPIKNSWPDSLKIERNFAGVPEGQKMRSGGNAVGFRLVSDRCAGVLSLALALFVLFVGWSIHRINPSPTPKRGKLSDKTQGRRAEGARSLPGAAATVSPSSKNFAKINW